MTTLKSVKSGAGFTQSPPFPNTNCREGKTVTPIKDIIQIRLVKSGAGFTLLETLIYIALLSFFLSSLLGITYQSLQSTQKISDQISLQQEANFLIRKMDWALTGAKNVVATNPTVINATTTTATEIRINRYDATTPIYLNYNSASSTMEIQVPADPAFYPLNSSNAAVNSTLFTITTNTLGTATTVDVSLMLNGQPFELKKYLR